MEITDEMMAEAVADMNEAMLRSLPKPEECHHEFSTRFERKMKRAIYRAEHPIQYRVMQRVASIVLVLFIGFMSILAISPTVRAAVFGWIREQYESFITYYFEDGTSPGDGPTEYYISGLTDDYAEVSAFYDEEFGNFSGIYADPNGNMLFFSYATIPENANFFIEETGYSVDQILISGNPADLYIAEDNSKSNCIIWCDEQNNVIFYISALIDENTLISLAESVSPQK